MGVQVTAKVCTYQVHLGVFTKKLESALMQELKAATAEWVKAVLKEIPVYTGTAKGTFAPISRVLSRFRVSNPYVGPVNSKARQKISRGFSYRGRHWALGYNAGMNYATHSFDMVTTTYGRGFYFTYINDLPYVLWNDMYPAPAWLHLKNITPWNAYQVGADAFAKYVQNEIPNNIPSVAGLISVDIVSIS